MKKYQLNPNWALAMAIIAGALLGWVITLFILMWYDKRPVEIAGQQYVREVTKWPGHTRVINLPVSYG